MFHSKTKGNANLIGDTVNVANMAGTREATQGPLASTRTSSTTQAEELPWAKDMCVRVWAE